MILIRELAVEDRAALALARRLGPCTVGSSYADVIELSGSFR